MLRFGLIFRCGSLRFGFLFKYLFIHFRHRNGVVPMSLLSVWEWFPCGHSGSLIIQACNRNSEDKDSRIKGCHWKFSLQDTHFSNSAKIHSRALWDKGLPLLVINLVHWAFIVGMSQKFYHMFKEAYGWIHCEQTLVNFQYIFLFSVCVLLLSNLPHVYHGRRMNPIGFGG